MAMFGSSRQLKQPKEKLYRGLKIGGDIGAATGIKTSRIRGVGYDFLDTSNTKDAVIRQMNGQGQSVARRFSFKGAAKVMNSAFSSLAPDIGGLGGRAMNVAYGRASKKALSYMDRVLFRAKLEINPKRMDMALQRELTKINSPLTKWQRSTHALAVANSLDPYATARAQKALRGDESFADLRKHDDILSAYSTKNYTPEEIDQLIQKADLDEIMSSKVRKPQNIEQTHHPDNIKTTSYTTEEGQINVSSAASTTARELDNLVDSLDEEFFDFLVEGQGVTYGFGAGGTATHEELVGAAGEIMKAASEVIKNTPITSHAELKSGQIQYIIASSLLEKARQGVDLSKSGKVRQAARKLRGDLIVQGTTKRRRWVRDGFVDGDISDEDLKSFRPSSRSKPGKVELVETTQIKKKKYQSKKVEIPNSDINISGTVSTTFTANRQRHNYVPTRSHIQRAIHSLDPDFKNKRSLVTFNVQFGGKTAKSKYADNQRDAYQIEFGGPATDKRGSLHERTDMFTFVPSLFMYRSAMNAAKAMGLAEGVSRGQKFRMSGSDLGILMSSKKFRKDMDRNSLPGSTQFLKDDASIAMKISSATASRDSKMVLDDLAATVKTNKTGALKTQNGNLILSAADIGIDTNSLEILDDILTPAIFGGRSSYIKKSTNNINREPFAKAIDDFDFRGNSKGNFFEVERQASNLFREKGKELGRYTQVDGETYNVAPYSLIRNGIDLDRLILSDLGDDILEAAPDAATRKLSQLGLIAQGEKVRNEFIFTFKQKFREMAQGSVDEVALDNAAHKAVTEAFDVARLQITRVGGGEDIMSLIGNADAIASALLQHMDRFGKMGMGRGKRTSSTTTTFDEVDERMVKRLRDGEPTFRDFVALLNDKAHLRAILDVDAVEYGASGKMKIKSPDEISKEIKSNFNTLGASRDDALNVDTSDIPNVSGKRKKKSGSTPRSSSLDEARAGDPQPINDNGLIPTSGNIIYDDIVKKIGGIESKKKQEKAFSQIVGAVENGRKINNQTVYLEVVEATELVMRKGFLKQGYIEHARRNHENFSLSQGVPFTPDTTLVGIQRYIASLALKSDAFNTRMRQEDAENEYDDLDLDYPYEDL